MQNFSQGQHEFLGSLLNVVIVKLRYDDETEWDADEDEPEEEALFFEMRKVSIHGHERGNTGEMLMRSI